MAIGRTVARCRRAHAGASVSAPMSRVSWQPCCRPAPQAVRRGHSNPTSMHPTRTSCLTHLTESPECGSGLRAYTIDAVHDGEVVGRLRGFVIHYHSLDMVGDLAGVSHDDLREAVEAVRFAMASTHDAPVSYVDVLLVAPKARGGDVARQLLERSWLYGDCGVSLLRPCPLQFCIDWLRPEDRALLGRVRIGGDPKRSLESLERFYARVGYGRLPATDFWWRMLPARLPV
ncbi:conserved hypothetical protein [Nitratidesulfovibrio vulgaris DP4]|uniref:Uncharacterized protein n=1 Tax=Nitratidesulfovibrio vulgaris (strain DP4) TaxID=391774 RepID=A0A0H3A5J2_NITV4|nr:conserved hypothetical protein [Nitratidesulfovibrio vulgaris DP4]